MKNDLLSILSPIHYRGLPSMQILPLILSCNKTTSQFGLTLSETEALELLETRGKALSSCGRIEFTNGIIDKLLLEFCDSPYITQQTYVETISDLIEIFYDFKNETLDEIDDDDLISYLKHSFDHRCNGSLELLKNREFENLTRKIRFGVEEENDEALDMFSEEWEDDYV